MRLLTSTPSPQPLAAHRVVLAAGSGYFRALFLGAGTAMREGQDGVATIELQHHCSQQLATVVEALYTGSLTA